MQRTLKLCAAMWVCGMGIFAGAYSMHTKWDLYNGNRRVSQSHSATLRAAVARRRTAHSAAEHAAADAAQ